jgi:Mlc titration factor MtfA (ptsG expression regulator)
MRRAFKYLMLELDSVKWYEGYEEVDVYTAPFLSGRIRSEMKQTQRASRYSTTSSCG